MRKPTPAYGDGREPQRSRCRGFQKVGRSGGEGCPSARSDSCRRCEGKLPKAEDRVARLQRGESVVGGVHRPMTLDDMLPEMGVTAAVLRHARFMRDLESTASSTKFFKSCQTAVLLDRYESGSPQGA